MISHQYTIAAVEKFKLNHFNDNNCSLNVLEHNINVPFIIQRVFTISAPKDSTRGNHAHKECAQILSCLNGCIKVSCDDGVDKKDILLHANEGYAVFIPPGIWSIQTYQQENSILMALCDKGFSEEEYIRDYRKYLEFNQVVITAKNNKTNKILAK